MPVRTATQSRTRRNSQPDAALEFQEIPSFEDGYNSYAQSRTLIKPTEVSAGTNAVPDGNGAMGKRAGKVAASPVLAAGYPVAALGTLKTPTINVKLALAGDTLWKYTDTTKTALTGITYVPAAPEDCRVVQAAGRAYLCAGSANSLSYTADGVTLSYQNNSFPLKYGVFYATRLYGVRPDYPDRIYYSNPINVDVASTSYDKSDFGTFNTDLAFSPKRNSGFIVLNPESGLVITSLLVKGDTVLVTTLDHGYWEVAFGSVSSTSGAVIHTVKQTVRGGGVPASNSVSVTDNDLMAFGGDNLYYYGEVALYAQPRTTAKSGRVQTDLQAVPALLRKSVCTVQFNQSEYVFYAVGSGYNDRAVARNKVLNAWSTPYTGWNVSCALVITDTDGRKRLFAGSSNPADCRVFALEEGFDDAGTPINFSFRDKALDGKDRGRMKRFAYTIVRVSSQVGMVTVQPYVDGIAQKPVTYTPRSTSGTLGGTGSKMTGSFATGDESGTGTIAAVQDITFKVKHNYKAGDLLEFVYSDAVTGNTVKILGRKSWFLMGDPQENLPFTKVTVLS